MTNLNSLNDLRFQRVPNRLMSKSQSKSSDIHAHEFCVISFCASLLGNSSYYYIRSQVRAMTVLAFLQKQKPIEIEA